jgi:hypothetical protein
VFQLGDDHEQEVTAPAAVLRGPHAQDVGLSTSPRRAAMTARVSSASVQRMGATCTPSVLTLQ